MKIAYMSLGLLYCVMNSGVLWYAKEKSTTVVACLGLGCGVGLVVISLLYLD